MSVNRFYEIQNKFFSKALEEIKGCRKTSHWMWFIFPQIKGLGNSEMSVNYGIEDLKEAQSFLNDPERGPNLIKICEELLKCASNDAKEIFGSPDNLKLQSSMTLFALVKNTNSVFQQVLDKFFYGSKDLKTIAMLNYDMEQNSR